MKKTILFILICGFISNIYSQRDSEIINKIYSNALNSFESYNTLKLLCDSARGRMVGTEQSLRALEILEDQIMKYKIDTCYRQDYYTSAWFNKSKSKAIAYYSNNSDTLNVCAIGTSTSTPESGIIGHVLELHTLNELDSLPQGRAKDKIIFFNRKMDNSELNTFDSYDGASDQRLYGAIEASEHGASGVIVRSLSTEPDDFPHTGVCRNKEGIKKIPALSISTNDAEKLSDLNKNNNDLKLLIYCNTETIDSIKTYNLIAEIKGEQYPEKILVIGAHIDSWYNTPGAHDDGAGCVQIIDVLRIFTELHIKPRHTIRLVLFMDEELNKSGALEYARIIGQKGEEHLVAIESDEGGFLPLGFWIDANDSIFNKISKHTVKLKEYGISYTKRGFPGPDILKLKKYQIPLIGLMTNSQRYFEYHHSKNDTFNEVSRRELQLGTASIAALVYLIDKYGIQ